MKIVFLDSKTIGQIPLDVLYACGDFVHYPHSTAEEARERVKDAEVILVNKVLVGKDLIDAAPNLKLVYITATGTNNIDMDYCKEKNIIVRNVSAYSTDSVAQNTFMHILNLMGNAKYYDKVVTSGDYSRSGLFTDLSHKIIEMTGKNIGIIGMGAIGQKVAQIALAFGMNVSYYSTSGTAHCTDYPALSLDELLSQSDVISINAPLNAKTANLIDYEQLCKMKKTAFIVNTGRGGIINEADLARAINEEIIAGAGLDVFQVEPIPVENPLLKVKFPNRVFFTPHTAWGSTEARTRLIEQVAENIKKGY